MRDLSEVVSAFETFINGNIQVIVLPDQGNEIKIDFGPQLRAFIAETLDNKLLLDHSEIVSTRLRECKNELNRFIESLQPKTIKRPDSIGRALHDRADLFDQNQIAALAYRDRFVADHLFSHSEREYNPADGRAIRKLHAKVAELYTLASKTNEQSVPDEHTLKVIKVIEQLEIATRKKAKTVAAQISRDYPVARPSVTDTDVKRCERRLEALYEAIVASSRQRESLDDLLDFMKLEVWAQRWRIYELWLLARVVLFLVKLNSQLKPLQRVSNGAWALKFSKDEEPAAQLTLGDVDLNVYYQYYQAASYGGDMPDIAVEAPGRGFILVLDPKHYRQAKPSEFKSVCRRYSEGFRPFLSCVSNYYPYQKPLEYVDDNTTQLVIYDVAPATTGLVTLEEAISQAIRSAWQSWEIPTDDSVIILFDVSASTSDVRAEMILDLKRRLTTIPVSEQSLLLPFAAEAPETGAIRIMDLVGNDFRLPGPSGNTNLNSAFERGFHLAGKILGACDVWFYSDGAGAIDLQALKARLIQSRVTLKIIDFARDENESALSGFKGIPRVSYEWARGHSM